MRIILTGCDGQVGKFLSKKLNNMADILALSRHDLDITNELMVHKIVEDFKPDFIINAAAYTAVDNAESEQEKAYEINRDGPLYLAKAAQDINATLIHISTDYVFAGDKDGVYSESDATSPQSVYGASKLAGEQAIIDHCEKYIILRTAWVFGETGHNFVKTMLRLAGDRDKLNIVDDQFGGPTYAGDIADAIILIVKKINHNDVVNWGVFHFSGQPYVSWFEFAKSIFEQAELQNYRQHIELSPITTAQFPTPAKRPANSKLECSKIKQEFCISPSHWQSAIRNLIGYI
ncbi:MAG: dTDP-4-dehydrorhamnose reductase [Hyphomicrobiales bacterium]|nr:MAG: dTDP-4-dehydrorhamnose reductase [Hyphomicrobiales bacterium]